MYSFSRPILHQGTTLAAKVYLIDLGPAQTSNFSCAESNGNEEERQILLISIRFGT